MELYKAIELVDYLQLQGYDAELYKGYSGRGMYGKETTGVTTDAAPYVMDELETDIEEILPEGYRTDNMGLDYIYY